MDNGRGVTSALRAAFAASLALLFPAAAPAQAPTIFTVRLAQAAGAPLSGRLLILAERWSDAAAERAGATVLVPGADRPVKVYLAAREVQDLKPGQGVDINADETAFPADFSSLPGGDYAVQAVLDVDHNFAYSGYPLVPDVRSNVARLTLPAATRPELTLAYQGLSLPAWGIESTRVYQEYTDDIAFQSPSLSAFYGKPTFIRGYVVKPPAYDRDRARYPTVYRTEGFGASAGAITGQTIPQLAGAMLNGKAPPMIWVVLDHSGPTGTHEFADSASNGPWGKALTEELIPWLEAHYRMDARPSGRFLTGHSSGGWMAIWDQVAYPKVFGGAWPIAPDPVDFHDFTNTDLYAAGANVYHRVDGTPTPLVRRNGAPIADFEPYTRLEDVEGAAGGQIASFDWVFSPKGGDGRPKPLFDHRTGAVDPQVAAYWRDHYDIAGIIERDGVRLKPDLDGKIHLIVGTLDTYYLDGPAHRLQAVMERAGIRADFRFVAGRDHGTILTDTADIPWQMYAVARPGAVQPKAR